MPRPRLIEKLNQGIKAGCKLTLISAPAGFGKTTLVTVAVHSSRFIAPNARVCWVSLDETDNDLTRFLNYLIAALQTIEPEVGETAMVLLAAPQPPHPEAVMTALINELARAEIGHHVVVLDDYHLITNRTVHLALSFLLENIPTHLHLAILTRVDPPLPLARWRARGQMCEIRQSDLRFTAVEAATFLNDVMGLSLSSGQVEILEARTEGWVAGLQLAALSLRGRENRADFLADFSGSHRFILDYLTGEVLQQLPDDLQLFLLQTSILNRLRGSLCEAVTGQEEGWRILEELEASNLFLVPLDEERIWFRYHRLFADVMRRRLQRFHPEDIPELHRRAADWFQRNGLFDEAVTHALAAHDYPLAARIVENQAEELVKRGHLATLLRWLDLFPSEVVQARPWLSVDAAWVYLLIGKMEKIEGCLAAAERNLDFAQDRDRLRGQIGAIRAYAAARLGQLDQAVEQARAALELLAEDDLTIRAVVAFVLGGVYFLQQDFERGLPTMLEAAQLGERAGNVHLAVGALSNVGDVLRQQGKLAESERILHQALQLGTGRSGQPLPTTAGVHSHLADIRLARKDYVAARQLALTGLALSKQIVNAEGEMLCHLTLAQIEHFEGNPEEARATLEKAKELATAYQFPPHRYAQIEACQAVLSTAPASQLRGALPETLSNRELEVLRLFAAGLTNQQIADKLIISLGTVKAHSSHIYRKLDVRNRAQAVIAAREMNLL